MMKTLGTASYSKVREPMNRQRLDCAQKKRGENPNDAIVGLSFVLFLSYFSPLPKIRCAQKATMQIRDHRVAHVMCAPCALFAPMCTVRRLPEGRYDPVRFLDRP